MLNQIFLQGRLVADPELKQAGEVSVAQFRIAVDRDYQPKGQEQRQADFINCVAWRQTGEFISKYFGKGDMILIEGQLQTRNYTDKDGNKRTAHEVVVAHAWFCGKKQDVQSTQSAQGMDVQPGTMYTQPAQAGTPQPTQYTPAMAARAQQGYAPAPMSPGGFAQVIQAAAGQGVPIQQVQPVTYPQGMQQTLPMVDDGDLPF